MDYKKLSGNSRVWVYQSSKTLSDQEVSEILSEGKKFINSWAAHGAELSASFAIFYNRFIVLFADETQVKASGCSIDASVHFIQRIQKAFDLDLFDRLTIAYKLNDEIETIHMSEFEEAIESGRLNEETTVFNNLVETKTEFENAWEIPLKESWHKKLMV